MPIAVRGFLWMRLAGSQVKGAVGNPHLFALPVLITPATTESIETNCGATFPFPLAFPFRFLFSFSATLTVAFNGQYKGSTQHAQVCVLCYLQNITHFLLQFNISYLFVFSAVAPAFFGSPSPSPTLYRSFALAQVYRWDMGSDRRYYTTSWAPILHRELAF